MGYGTFQDSEGNRSSKRIAGTVIAGVGGLFLLVVGVVSIFRRIADPQTALEVGKLLMLTGGGLLGVGVVEKFRPGSTSNGGGN